VALADYDLGNKRKFALHFCARLCLGHSGPNNERARRADIDGAEMLELFGQFARPKGPVASYVNSSQKNNECHSIRLNDTPLKDIYSTAPAERQAPDAR
jgi:hypothetical protein